MTIKSKILLVILAGIACLFLANIYSSSQMNTAHKRYSSDESLTAHSSAWFSNLDTQFVSNLLAYDPMDGSEKNASYWDPSLNEFDGSTGPNPLFAAITNKNIEVAEELFGRIFSDAIMEELLTFAIAYDRRGLQLYCESSLYLVGVDPCEESAQPDYFLKFGSFVDSLEDGSVRRVTQINDLSGGKPVSINDTLAFALIDENDSIIGLVVVGRNVIDGLEQFSENFEISTAILMGERALTVHDYYDEERPPELNTLIKAGTDYAAKTGTFSYSFIAEEQGARISSIPFSKDIRGSDLRILIFDDQADLLATLKQEENKAFLAFALVSLVIVGLVFLMTTSSFRRIIDAIHLLERMGQGDLSAASATSGLFSSKNDEVSRLQRTIEDYRSHRLEAESHRVERAKRRDERDRIMFEKMALLADQLEGQAREMLKVEIESMQELVSSGSDEDKERASIEVMSKAFSRMSDEVTTLIDARTHELVAAKDEINSSIRYAAKLQNALLPKTMPGDFNINVEWRPRDLVGGDIYFIKDYPDRVYIAVVDCTGHGVPGAFLSIIARSHLDKAIDVDRYQSAGAYLSQVNELLKETLARSDKKNTSEEGFDGGVCIYYRKERKLEFAGAKSSLFNVDGVDAIEISGNRKSVGSTRMSADFNFTTHEIASPRGAFVMLTDGITDVMSPAEKPIAFGRRRVLKILRESSDKTPASIVDNIMSSVNIYRGGAPFRDDLTLLAFSLIHDEPEPSVVKAVGETT
ncbi:MAG: SpoIIE family protein phosphatase [Halieaceae bacterium]|jgi:serine phosphatase RsbU (regulator of sigma subunit)